jgi:hypothetical protein
MLKGYKAMDYLSKRINGLDNKMLKLQVELFSSVLKTRINRTNKVQNISFDRKFSGNHKSE